MLTIAKLRNNQSQYQLTAATSFKKIEISAQVSNAEINSLLPILELKLQNETESFTLFLSQSPNTHIYTPVDILTTARQLPALQHKLFNSLQVTNTQPEALNVNQEITLQFTIAE